MYANQLFSNPRLLESYPAGISLTTAEDEPSFVYVNPAFCAITGYDALELLGHSPKLLQGDLTDPTVTQSLRRHLAAREPWKGATVNYRKDGTPFRMEWIIFPVYDDSERLINWGAIQHDVTERDGLSGQQQRGTAQLTTEYFEFLAAYEHTLSNLANELHDNIGQQLTLLSHRIGGLMEKARRNTSFRNELIELASLTHSVSVDLRQLMHTARSQTLADFGLYNATEELVRRMNRIGSIHVSIQKVGDKQRFLHPHETNLYRIIQEALTNVMKHSQAKQAEVHFFYLESTLQIVIADDGRGLPTDSQLEPGIGLRSMAQRAAAIGADLEVQGAPGHGTRVVLTVPLIDGATADPFAREPRANYELRLPTPNRLRVPPPKA